MIVELLRAIESKIVYDIDRDAPQLMGVFVDVGEMDTATSIKFRKDNLMTEAYIRIGAKYTGITEKEARLRCAEGIRHHLFGEMLCDLREIERDLIAMPPDHPVRAKILSLIKKCDPSVKRNPPIKPDWC